MYIHAWRHRETQKNFYIEDSSTREYKHVKFKHSDAIRLKFYFWDVTTQSVYELQVVVEVEKNKPQSAVPFLILMTKKTADCWLF